MCRVRSTLSNTDLEAPTTTSSLYFNVCREGNNGLSVPDFVVGVLVEGVEVESHSGREEHRVLGYDADAGAQRLQRDGRRVDAPDEHLPASQLLDAKQGVHQAALARPRSWHDHEDTLQYSTLSTYTILYPVRPAMPTFCPASMLKLTSLRMSGPSL